MPAPHHDDELKLTQDAPLTLFEQLSLPKMWRITEVSARPELPRDPLAFLEGILKSHEPTESTQQSSTTASQGDSSQTGISKSDLVEFAIQTWRLQKRVDGMDPEKNKRERKQFADSAKRFAKFLERFGVEYEDPTGKPYSTGWLEVEVISWDDPEDGDSPVESGPWIKQTVSPIIRQNGTMIKPGQIVCVEPED